MMKRMTVAILATIFFGSLAGCGDKGDDTAGDTGAVEETGQASE